jgi:hypothetical protein
LFYVTQINLSVVILSLILAVALYLMCSTQLWHYIWCTPPSCDTISDVLHPVVALYLMSSTQLWHYIGCAPPICDTISDVLHPVVSLYLMCSTQLGHYVWCAPPSWDTISDVLHPVVTLRCAPPSCDTISDVFHPVVSLYRCVPPCWDSISDQLSLVVFNRVQLVTKNYLIWFWFSIFCEKIALYMICDNLRSHCDTVLSHNHRKWYLKTKLIAIQMIKQCNVGWRTGYIFIPLLCDINDIGIRLAGRLTSFRQVCCHVW